MVRLLIACNVLSTLQRSHYWMGSADAEVRSGKDVQQGDNLVLLLLTGGAFREALDAFDDATHLFHDLRDADAITEVEKVRRAIGEKKKDPSSFYMRVATHYRVVGGFHWSREAIEQFLSKGAPGLSSRLFTSPDQPSIAMPARYVVADEVLAEVTLGPRKPDMRSDFRELGELIASFLSAVDTLLAHHLLQAGCKKSLAK